MDATLSYSGHTPEIDAPDQRTWDWYGLEMNGYPAALIGYGFIQFDGKTITVVAEPPGLIREKTAIGTPRTAHIANLTFTDCEDFLLKTDFGKRRTIECPIPGLIAEDHYSPLKLAFYPVKRLVAFVEIEWGYSAYDNLNRAPPYEEGLVRQLHELGRHVNFQGGCNVAFLDILRER